MTTTATKLPNDLITLSVTGRFFRPVSDPIWVNASQIERDGRRQAKAIADLTAEGHIEKFSDPTRFIDGYRLTDKVYDLVQPEPVNIIQEWVRRFDPKNEATHQPYVPVVPRYDKPKLSLGQIKTLFADRNRYEWYTIPTEAVPGIGLLGPMPFDDAIAAIRAAVDKKTSVGRVEMDMVVTSPQLREIAADMVRKAKIDAAFPDHIDFGLSSVGVVNEEEAKWIVGKRSTSLLGGRSLKSITLGNDPDRWADSLERERDRLLASLGEIQASLLLISKVQQGVQEKGGWDAVKLLYRAALEATYDDELGQKPQEGG